MVAACCSPLFEWARSCASLFKRAWECVLRLHCAWKCVSPLHCHCACKRSSTFACAWEAVQFCAPLTVTSLLLWLVYRPNRFRPHVDSAALAAFDLTPTASNPSGASLRYDLSLDLSFRNSHRRLGIHYLDLEAAVFYNGTKLGPADDSLPAPFYQGPANTTVVHPAFRGVAGNDTAAAVAGELAREAAAGTLHLQVRLTVTLMYKVWLEKAVGFSKYDCWLWFPPPRNGTASVFDAGTPCWRVK